MLKPFYKMLTSLVDHIHETFIAHSPNSCTRVDEEGETCYSADREKACDHCAINIAFTNLIDALKGNACPRCGGVQADVYERYSFGVYAGKFCDDCCLGYRDHCGLDGAQGDPADLDEVVEPADYY